MVKGSIPASLRELLLSHNQISQVDLSAMPYLVTTPLSPLSRSKQQVSKSREMNILDLSFNSLTKLKPSASLLIHYLCIEGNPMISFEPQLNLITSKEVYERSLFKD